MCADKRSLNLLAIMLIMVLGLSCACFGAGTANHGEITASGTIQKQGITTYMYGTHVLLDDKGKTLYALRSNSVDLDRYVDRKVTLKGSLVPGYPVDFGPDYLDVKSVE